MCSRIKETELATIIHDMEEAAMHPVSAGAQGMPIAQPPAMPRVHVDQFQPTHLRKLLASSTPAIVTGLNLALQLAWDPEWMRNKYGSENCIMEDCEEVEKSVPTKLGFFLNFFYSAASAVWRVKVRILSRPFYI